MDKPSANLIEKALAFEEIEQGFLQKRLIVLADARLADRYFRIAAATAEAEKTAAWLGLRAADDLVPIGIDDTRFGDFLSPLAAMMASMVARSPEAMAATKRLPLAFSSFCTPLMV